MKRSAKFSLFRWVKTLFNQIFHSADRPSVADSSLSEIGADFPSWDKRDTMVGSVRSWEQLSYNLSHRCYYVPGRFLTEEHFPIGYIALHERDSQEIPCIAHLGEVVSVSSVPRETIPVSMRSVTDPNELYYFFAVKEWEALPHRIEIRDTPWGKPLFTHRFLLDRCQVSWELFAVSSSEDYNLLRAIHTLLKSRKGGICPISKDLSLVLKKGTLTVMDKDSSSLASITVKEYKATPYSAFLRLKKGLL